MARHLREQHKTVWKQVANIIMPEFTSQINTNLSEEQKNKIILEILNPSYEPVVHTKTLRRIHSISKE